MVMESSSSRLFGQCIVLMGPPGAGKTTVARELQSNWGLIWKDVDDDVLESTWGCSVAQKLENLGDKKFLQAEAEATQKILPFEGVLSLTGSNPMDDATMQYLSTLGPLVLLDVPTSTILARMEQMKVDRIVGIAEHGSLKAVLNYRQQFYQKYHDIKISVLQHDTPLDLAAKIYESVQQWLQTRLISTRFRAPALEFLPAVKKGLAKDGGLYVPVQIPKVDQKKWEHLKNIPNYIDFAAEVLSLFPLGLSHKKIRQLCARAYESFESQDVVPLENLGPDKILELFRGPTAAFKDMALQLTPQFFTEATQSSGEKNLILAATSGDTGVAAISGYKKEPNTKVLVLFPEHGVSSVQKKQMLAEQSDRVQVVGLNEDFDYCQATVKKLFADSELSQLLYKENKTILSSANSINWGRLLPQIVYYAWSSIKFWDCGGLQTDQVNFCVPTGNFGNILAGYYAKKMGFPIGKLICASNENDVLTEFIKTGRYDIRTRKLHKTISPSIDILRSSNIERLLFELTNRNGEATRIYMEQLEQNQYFDLRDSEKQKLREHFLADSCNESQALGEIRRVLEQHHYLLDTHTAVASYVRQNFTSLKSMIIVSTAHYGKFVKSLGPVLKQLKIDPSLDDLAIVEEVGMNKEIRPPAHKKLIEALHVKLENAIVMEPDYSGIRRKLIEFALN